MTPHLDELISLVKHPAIQGRRGPAFYEGDAFYYEGEMYFVGNCSLDGDLDVLSPGCGCCEDLMFGNDEKEHTAIWLPPLSDPIQPERGLMGMLNNFMWLGLAEQDPKLRHEGWVCVTVRGEYIGPTPEIAVAKAIVAQWEEK